MVTRGGGPWPDNPRVYSTGDTNPLLAHAHAADRAPTTVRAHAEGAAVAYKHALKNSKGSHGLHRPWPATPAPPGARGETSAGRGETSAGRSAATAVVCEDAYLEARSTVEMACHVRIVAA